MKEFCNPLNLEYKYQHYGKTIGREAADPTLILFKGRYYLFASMSAGFYYSDDLVSWKWHENRDLDIYQYAPDVHEKDGKMYFCSSTDPNVPSAIRVTEDPLKDDFQVIAKPFPFWDPALLFDDDGKTYLYYGCGNAPLHGRELDSQTFEPVSEEMEIMREHITEHGFERGKLEGIIAPERTSFLMKYIEPMVNPKGLPYFEGAFVNKFGGKYYFQYAAPGTELNTYGDAVYISDHPLSGFRYQQHNPFSFKPLGFIKGAGHGSTVEDKHGNLWHVASMQVSVNAFFERRIGLFPAGVDEDGILFCNQNFGDYPMIIPEGKFDPKQIQPHYMLLSYKKKAKASSSLPGHGVELALNEEIRDWWCAKGSSGEWYELDLGKAYPCHSVQINFADEGVKPGKYPKKDRSRKFSTNYRYIDSGKTLHTSFLLEGSLDGKTWFMLKDASCQEEDLAHDYVVLEEGTMLRYVKVTSVELPYGEKFALSGLRVFGLDNKEKPHAPVTTGAVRTGDLDAEIQWKKEENAVGYNVRIGIAPDKLYTSYLVYEKDSVKITSLNKGVDYYYAVDSFNESGVTLGQVHKM